MATPSLTATATPPLVPRATLTRAGRFFLDHFLVLPLSVAIALVWANTAGESYYRFALAWAWPVNEIGMAIFLALIAQEVYEAVMPGGALHVWRNWLLPVAGAIGGVVGAVLVYGAFVAAVHQAALGQAWPVAVTIDLAAGYFVIRLVYPRRSAALAFLLLLAVVTDAFAMAVITLQAPDLRFAPAGALLLVAALGLGAALRSMNVRSFWPYWIACGTLSWLSMYWMGLHPALALIPIVPLLPHDPRPRELFEDRMDDQPVHRAEHTWNGLAQVALFLFGLVNAGVILTHYDAGTWAVLVAAVIGRPLGVLGGVALAVAAGLKLPRGIHWRDLTVIALATTSGFTFALFVAAVALPIGGVSGQITLGALSTSLGAVIAIVVAWLLGAGKFARRRMA
jgi:NhaA family Na+:H+ antiporter